MATKDLLSDLCVTVRQYLPIEVRFESIGGVDVARDIRAGTPADLVVLGVGPLDELDAEGLLAPGTVAPLFVSDVVAAVPDSLPAFEFGTERDLVTALREATRIAYSTGPSGTAFVELLERLHATDEVATKLVQAEAGTPVAALLASGDSDLGFQQRSEFTGAAGVRVLGALPGVTAIRSTFGGAVPARSQQQAAARQVLGFFASERAAEIVRAGDMTPWSGD